MDKLLGSPNNLLGIEYCKAILRQDSPAYSVHHPAAGDRATMTMSWRADRLQPQPSGGHLKPGGHPGSGPVSIRNTDA